MSEILAKCPHCSTSFSVTSDQLAIAESNVRCGVCMKVFKVETDAAPQQAAAPAQAAPAAEQPTPSPAGGDNIADWLKQNPSGSSTTHGSVGAPTEDEKTESFNFEDDIADDFFNTDDDDAGSPLSPKTGSATEEIKIELETGGTEVPAYAAELKNAGAAEDRLSDVRSKGYDPLHETQLEAELKVEDLGISEDAFGANDDNDSSDDFDDNPFAIDIGDDSFTQVELDAQVVEEEETFMTRYGETTVWGGATFAVTLLLLIQALISEFDGFARDPDMRFVYQPFCSIGICTLPKLEDISAIRGSNLIIRPHPRQNGALIVDAIVNNQAAFAQEFPVLNLQFSNIQGGVIASRQFTPAEYLTRDLKQLKHLPSNTPIHLSLEIVDPGKEAVSYHLGFSPQS